MEPMRPMMPDCRLADLKQQRPMFYGLIRALLYQAIRRMPELMADVRGDGYSEEDVVGAAERMFDRGTIRFIVVGDGEPADGQCFLQVYDDRHQEYQILCEMTRL